MDGRKKLAAALACLALVASVFAVYWQVRDHEFVNYDDLDYVVDNPHVRSGLTWKSVVWVFTHSHASNWHPVTWISHMIDYEIFGRAPRGHHMVSVAFHALNAALLFLALRSMTGAFWRCLIVAALFAVHPLRVESVAWVAERKDLLCGSFFMLTLLAYCRYVKRSTTGGYLLVLAAFAMGLLSKPMLVMLPFVLLLLDVWPLDRWRPSSMPPLRILLEKLPMLALAAAAGVITMFSQESAGAFYRIPFASRLANAPLACVAYLWKTVWPARLSVFYPHPADIHPPGDATWIWLAVAAAVALFAVTCLVVWQHRARPYLVVGWLWFLGSLVPVLGLLQVGRQAYADRYTYLPLIGIYTAVVWGLAEMSARWPACRSVLRIAAPVVLLMFMSLSRSQAAKWRTSITLFEHSLAVTESNILAHYNLGTALLKRGEPTRALPHFEEAVRIAPEFADGHANLGAALLKLGRPVSAAEHLSLALRLQPEDVEAHFNLGHLRMAEGRLDQAARHYGDALHLDPDHVESHTNLGVVYAMRGDTARAEEHFRTALRLDPGHTSALMNLRRLLGTKGESAAAGR
jgi:Flp pilus assembly protein TadD